MKYLSTIFFSLILFGLLHSGVGAVEVEVTTNLDFIPGCSGTSCNVGTGFSVVQDVMGAIIKYFTYIAFLGGALFIVINGVLYSMAGIDQSLKDSAKKRIIATLLGLILLMLSGPILNIIAPWIYK